MGAKVARYASDLGDKEKAVPVMVLLASHDDPSLTDNFGPDADHGDASHHGSSSSSSASSSGSSLEHASAASGHSERNPHQPASQLTKPGARSSKMLTKP